jgi:hypothetical protein
MAGSGRFTHGKGPRYPLYRVLDGPQGRSGRLRKIFPPSEFEPQTFQTVAIHCIDWHMAAPWHFAKVLINDDLDAFMRVSKTWLSVGFWSLIMLLINPVVIKHTHALYFRYVFVQGSGFSWEFNQRKWTCLILTVFKKSTLQSASSFYRCFRLNL